MGSVQRASSIDMEEPRPRASSMNRPSRRASVANQVRKISMWAGSKRPVVTKVLASEDIPDADADPLLFIDDILLEPISTKQVIHVGDVVNSPIHNTSNLLATEEGEEIIPPAVFCELMELHHEDELAPTAYVWKESARWVKYEETVEFSGTRFSKPHITLFTMKNVLQVRSCLRRGLVLLDLQTDSYENLIAKVMDNWEKRHDFPNADIGHRLRLVLLSQKNHLRAGKGRHSSSIKLQHHSSADVEESNHLNTNTLEVSNQHHRSPSSAALDKLDKLKGKAAGLLEKEPGGLIKKLPTGTEAAVLMVGHVDTLLSPICAFVRLKDALDAYPELPEVPVNVRFVFILLTPLDHYQNEALQIGKCMATLLVDEVYGKIAYKARDSFSLVDGVEEMLSQGLILPPGKWAPNGRLEPPDDMAQATRKEPKVVARNVKHPEITASGRYQKVEGLQRTGRPFGGLVDDLRRKLPWYASDYLDAFRGRISQVLAATIILYFANVTKIITFGGVMGQMLEGQMGTVENLLAGGICGVIYALFSGQPLSVLSATGPTLVFEFIMYRLCKDIGWEYMPTRFWVGAWTVALLLILVVTDASVVVALITRFTEESFATLISIIFIIQAFEHLFEYEAHHPITKDITQKLNQNCLCYSGHGSSNASTAPTNTTLLHLLDNGSSIECLPEHGVKADTSSSLDVCMLSPDVFMFSVIIFFATFVFAISMKKFRHSGYFPGGLRHVIADLGVFLAIVIVSAVNYFVGIKGVPTLPIPAEFKHQPFVDLLAGAPVPPAPSRGRFTTEPLLWNSEFKQRCMFKKPTIDRPWIVNPLKIAHWWVAVAAILPALMFTILVFMDQQITAVIVNRKDNRLRKGLGYHLDLLVISSCIMVCAVIGLPYYVAATVISILHLDSLKMMSECAAPGEKPQFLGVKEQRVTALVAHILIGITVLMSPVVKLVPMPALLGVFLYMGVVALVGQQFVSRILILFMPQKYQPDYVWLRLVELKRVHLFTAIQVVGLLLLFIVKYIKAISIGFPLMLLVMMLMRRLMAFVFTTQQLNALDDPLPTLKEILQVDRKQYDVQNGTVDVTAEEMVQLQPKTTISVDA